MAIDEATCVLGAEISRIREGAPKRYALRHEREPVPWLQEQPWPLLRAWPQPLKSFGTNQV